MTSPCTRRIVRLNSLKVFKLRNANFALHLVPRENKLRFCFCSSVYHKMDFNHLEKLAARRQCTRPENVFTVVWLTHDY